MTFSIIGRCTRTGMLGIAIATSDIAVGSRCVHVEPGVGAIISQAASNPRLGRLGLHLLRAGYRPARVVEELVAGDSHPARRQLAALNIDGDTAAHTGARTRPWTGHRTGANAVAAANIVAGAAVVEAMFTTFEGEPAAPLWERLLAALEAGKTAGGEPAGEQSAALHVVDRAPYALVDLRVDLHTEPVAELRRVAQRYFPLISYFQRRPFEPDLPPAAEWLRAQGS